MSVQLWDPPSLLFSGYYRLFSWVQSGQSLKLGVGLRISGGVPMLPLYAFVMYVGDAPTICLRDVRRGQLYLVKVYCHLYVHVTVRRYRFPFNNQPDRSFLLYIWHW